MTRRANCSGEALCKSFFFFSSRRRHTRLQGDWSSDVCSSDLYLGVTMLRSRQEDDLPSQPVAALSDMAALRTGFLTNALNPKTTVFVVSLFLQIDRKSVV